MTVATSSRRQKDYGPVGQYVGSYHADDPRRRLMDRAKAPRPEGMVAVPAALIREVFEMRVCRATMVATGDEDGPLKPMTVHCVEQAGHLYPHHNGYFTWEDR